MNKELKDALNYAFEPPAAEKKEVFLSKLNYPKSTQLDFFLTQVAYIRKRVWIFSLLLLCGAFLPKLSSDIANGFADVKLIWILSAMLPFLALLTITEISRSASFNMAELEMSCRFGLPDIVITRATILGVINLIILILFSVVTSKITEFSFLRSGLYLIVPYMLTCLGLLLVQNWMPGKESVYGYGAVTCFVSLFDTILSGVEELIYSEKFIYIWAIIFALSSWRLIKQLRKLIKRAEENSWNSLSID